MKVILLALIVYFLLWRFLVFIAERQAIKTQARKIRQANRSIRKKPIVQHS